MAAGRPRTAPGETGHDVHALVGVFSQLRVQGTEPCLQPRRSTNQMNPTPPDHEHDPTRNLPAKTGEAIDHYIEQQSKSHHDAALQSEQHQLIARVFGLLDLGRPDLDEISDGRVGRISRTILSMPNTPQEDQFLQRSTALTGAAARVVDGFAGGGQDLEALRVLQLLDASDAEAGTPEQRQARIDRVMQMVISRGSSDEASHEKNSDRLRLSPPRREEIRSRKRIQLSDFVAIAAVLLVGTAVLFPSMFSVNTMAIETQCALNMQQAGLGFDLFAKDHDGRLPARSDQVRSPQTAAIQWWSVGDPGSSHSANLYVLIREDYVPMEALACPGNQNAPRQHDHPHAADWEQPEHISYSYQLFNGRPPRHSDPGVKLLLTDRSPIIAPSMRGETVDATSNSHNHRDRGQSVMLPDFSVYFVTSPVLGDGDNMWLPRSLESGPRQVKLTGTERPVEGDAFVGP
jgi:hypothetical protein